MKTIIVDVQDEFMRLSSNIAGAAGSYNAAILELSFNESWADLTKTVYMYDARGGAVYILIGPTYLKDGETDVWQVPIPAEPLAYQGDMTLTIKGTYVDGEEVTVTMFTASKLMKVLDSSYADTSEPPAQPTPTQAEQLSTTVNTYLTAEQDRVTAESARAAAEVLRASAEDDRVDAEADRVTAETIRGVAEFGRFTSEQGRVSAEAGRVSAESGRVSADSSRVSAESGRVAAESARVTAESARQDAEDDRDGAETLRGVAEFDRFINEQGRVSAEAGRVAAEAARVLAEAARLGIASFALTDGDHSPGTTDTYTITFTDASTADITVYNGADGEGSGDMLASTYDTNGDGKVDAADVADAAPWAGITDKPATFTPSSHSHTKSDISDFPVLADVATSGSYNDLSNKPTIPDASLPEKNLVNILRLKLQQALAAADIDAWSDLLADDSLLNAGASTNVTVSGGKLAVTETTISQLTGATGFVLGHTSFPKCGQTFLTPASESALKSVTVKLANVGSPTDGVVCKIYAASAGVATGSALYTAAETVAYSDLTTSYAEKTFTFSGAALLASSEYAVIFERTGSTSSSNYYNLYRIETNQYADGKLTYYNGSTWTSSSTSDAYFSLSLSTTSMAIWTAVTPTEAIANAAICAEQTLNSGTITWYLSDDGTNYTEITSLDTMQNVAFDQEAVYLKCVITGDATVDAVAYGGY